MSGINHQLVIAFLTGAILGSFTTWFLIRKKEFTGQKLSLLQMLNVAILVGYMFASNQPQETVIITLAGFLFGEPLGRVIVGGKDGKKN